MRLQVRPKSVKIQGAEGCIFALMRTDNLYNPLLLRQQERGIFFTYNSSVLKTV